MIEFTVLDEPKQRFSVIINQRRVTFDLWYNQSSDRWTFDLSLDGAPVLQGRRIVTGVDLIAPFKFDIGVLIAYNPSGLSPGRNDLIQGIAKLYSATQEEYDASIST